MRVLLLVIAWALGMVTGCGSSGSAQAKVDPAAAAGDVREVTGTVTGVLAGERRALAIGDVVAAGERIETGADGDVVIVLRHNQVRWHLGPSQARRPLDAAAWTAATPTGPVEPGGDRTAAAGRLAEREGADTAATAVAIGDGEDPPPAGQATVRTTTEPEEPADEVVEPKRDVRGDGDPKVETTAGTDRPHDGHANDRKKGGADLPEQLDRESIRSVMIAVGRRLAACGADHAGTRVRLDIKVAPEGSVTGVTVDGVEGEAVGCLTRAMKRVRFPRTRQGGSFRYPVAF